MSIVKFFVHRLAKQVIRVMLALLALTLLACPFEARAVDLIETIAGGGGEGGLATFATLRQPYSVAVDSAGNVYIADSYLGLIRKVSTSGIITTVVGQGQGLGAQGDGLQFSAPRGLALDGAGNLYVADANIHLVRKISTSGTVTTVAGTLYSSGFGGDGGPATAALLLNPSGVAVDSAGNVYIGDCGNARIRKVDTAGIITTVAGNGTATFGGDGGAATAASLSCPMGVALDAAGNLFIADCDNDRIRKVNGAGIISTVAGNGTPGYSGDGGAAVSASLHSPMDVRVDGAGNLFIADLSNSRIRKVSAAGVISTVAGNGVAGFSGDGSLATATGLNQPSAAALDGSGNLYIADTNNFRIRKVNTSGVISTLAGNGSATGDGGPATAANLWEPYEARPDGLGNYYITDFFDQRVRKVDSNGIITTVAGNGTSGFSGDGGPATAAQFNGPWTTAIDKNGNLYISDRYNNRIRKVDTAGIITTVVGGGISYSGSGDGGPATAAGLVGPYEVAFDSVGDLLIADTYGRRIRKVDTAGIITTVAGGYEFNPTGDGDGGPATSAGLDVPYNAIVDRFDNLIISDTYHNRIRIVNTAGIIDKFAGTGTTGFSGDGGPALSAGMQEPAGLAVDATGNLFFADLGNSRIRKVDTAGVITTVAGNGVTVFAGDGGPATAASLRAPFSVKLDPTGNLYIADSRNRRIRRVNTGASILPPAITTQPANQTVTAGQTATFSVVASGTAPLSYQWRKNGTNIAGATSSSYTTQATTTADNGALFSVVVSNSAGSVTSNNATLTVNAALVPPAISTQPASITVTAGQTATFTVTVAGTAPLSYQWRKNGTNIGGATSSTYTTPATTTADNGALFSVVVSNSAGSVTSNNATLTVNTANQPPVITSAATATPNPATIGQSVTFTVAASDPDGDPLTYTWDFGDATSGSGSSATHAYAAAGTYAATVTISDGNGSSVSSAVSVVVNTSSSGGLVAYWKLDEGSGTTAADSSGNGNAGTLRNGPSWVAGEIGGALQLNGANQDVLVADSSSLNITGTGLTLAAWIYPTAVSGGDIIHKDLHYTIYRRASGAITYADSQTWSYATIGDHGTTPLNAWSHVAVTFDGNSIRFFINGVLIDTVARSGSLVSNSNSVYLGSYAGSSNFFAGGLDDMRVYNRALSASEVVALASVSNPVPVITSATTATGTAGSAFNYAITATNNPASFNAIDLPAGLSVDTATGIISGIPTTAGTSSVTISATSAGGTGTAGLSLTIESVPTITGGPSVSPNPASVDQTVTFSVTASDGDGDTLTYNWVFGDGSSGSGATATHAYATAGTYTANVTVSDPNGDSVTSSITVNINNPPKMLHVAGIAMSLSTTSKGKAGVATVTIKDSNGVPFGGAAVSGTWSGLTSANVSGTTGSAGTVKFTSARTKSAGTFTFTVTNVTKTGYTYDSTTNVVTSTSITTSGVVTSNAPAPALAAEAISSVIQLDTVAVNQSFKQKLPLPASLTQNGKLKSTGTGLPKGMRVGGAFIGGKAKQAGRFTFRVHFQAKTASADASGVSVPAIIQAEQQYTLIVTP